MRFDEFASRFRKPDEAQMREAQTEAAQPPEVIVAGTVGNIGDDVCTLIVNGFQYDIPRGDIGEVQLLSALSIREGDKEAGDDGGETGVDDVVLFRLPATTVLWQRIPVQAAFVAAAGTWVSLVPANAGTTTDNAPASA